MSPGKNDPFEQLLKKHLSASVSRPPAEDCPDENWMAAYLEGAQSENFKKTFERHLLQCDRCQAEMALLLKIGGTEAQPKPSAVDAESGSKSNHLSLLFGWTGATVFRPVFAILLVSVVTGVVGYRLLRDERIFQERSIEMSQSTRNSPVADADESSAGRSVDGQKPQEQRLKSESSSVRLEAVPDRFDAPRAPEPQPGDLRSKGKTSKQENEMKDAFATEPPSVPVESGRDAVVEPKRRDVAVAPQSLPEPLQKESLSAAVVDRENKQLQTKADDASAKSKNQVMPATPPPGARPVVGALSERRTEQDKIANAEEARAAGVSEKKKQVLTESARQAAAFEGNERNAVSPVEVGGKRFDLSDGVWRDSSILPDDPWPTLVSMNSPDFEKYRKQLAPYQQVLSRPEDVLIKLHNRVYRIQKAPK